MREHTRRAFLRGTAAAAVTGVAATGGASAQSVDYGGWFDGVGNFDGTVDRTGQSEVTVTVGAAGNGGNYAFDPPAIHVDPGTTVTWRWANGMHNVVDTDGAYESKLTRERGFTFSHTFESPGVSTYYCKPHKPMGMKGAVVVGDPTAGASGGPSVEQRLVLGGGIGLVGALLALFAWGTRQNS